MPLITYRQALTQAIIEEMRRDENIFVIGEDVAQYEGAYRVTEGILSSFGDMRIKDTPIAEEVIVGVGVGAAMAGLRPIIELMTVNFSLLAIDQIVNHAAKIHYMSGGQFAIPMVIRMPQGSGMQLGAQHSQYFDAWFASVPGLKVVAPSSAYDAKGLLKSSIRDNNPIIFLEHQLLYPVKEDVPDDDYTVPIGKAITKRPGKDITIISYLRTVNMSLSAAEKLKEDGIEAEVIDLRSLRPLDEETILSSIKKTHRAIIIEEDLPQYGVGANISDIIQRESFDYLDAPINRICSTDTPMPYSRDLELSALPDEAKILKAVREMI